MKKLLLITVCLLFSMQSWTTPVREFRATWIATVSNIDWPKTKITIPGSFTQITAQQNELITILDSLVAANMNAALLQIRPMADALYSTKITCWSAYLTGQRGVNPGYDPLAFAIEEAHKRGLELHGWMNPYRYANASNRHASTDYLKVQHPEWLLGINTDTIMDPGLPAVRKHIANVTKEVLINYPDIDGIIWDDYFYIESIGSGNQDQATYLAYNPDNLSLVDWRRDNVNRTVQEVFDTIQSVNPGVRFGISPRGIWSTSVAAAQKYGVTLPTGITGSDNYNAIYCDALAWLKAGSIDYISPQLYWATTSTGQDYDVLAPWWQSVAARYGRHFYASQALYKNEWDYAETGLQIDDNRNADNVAPGSIFYNTSSFSQRAFPSYLRANAFSTKILPPVISWYPSQASSVYNVGLSGNSINWQCAMTEGSYGIYAVPNQSVGYNEFSAFDHLLTRTWSPSKTYDLSAYSALFTTHQFAVAAIDRFENQSEPVYVSSTGSDYLTGNKYPSFVFFTTDDILTVQVRNTTVVAVFSIDGTCFYQGKVTGELTLRLPRGLYIVRIGMSTEKIVI
ncbi:MAG: family 10 glycosylhydrolase [Prevotellaceae bacterium]|nr:family 10 glycosylhydrolase [Prevotellaceae bacterium]